MFCYLHWHSHFSLLKAIGSPKQLISQAQHYQLDTLALTDYDSIYGAIEFYQWCKKNNLKPIIWTQLMLVQDLSKATDKQAHSYITLIALNQDGYHQILKLVSDAHTVGFYEGARVDLSMIANRIHDCIITLWGNRSYFNSNHNPDGIQTVSQACRKLQDIVWPSKFAIEYIVQDYDREPELQHINEFAMGIAHQLQAPLVCNPDYHYVLSQDREIYEIALCIKDSQTLFDRHRKKIQGHYHLMSESEILTILHKHQLTEGEISTMIQANQSFADQCNVTIQIGSLYFPQYTSSPEITTLYETYQQTYQIST